MAQAEVREPDQYYVGSVEWIGELSEVDSEFPTDAFRSIRVRVDVGSKDSWVVDAEYNDNPTTVSDDLAVGDSVVLLRTQAFVGETRYIVTDRYRIPALAILTAAFIGCAVLFAGRRGLTSVLGLGFSVAILLQYTVPSIVSGQDPFVVASVSAFVIAIVSLTVAHGFSRQTIVALVSTLLTLVLSLGLSHVFVRTAHLLGLGSEEAFFLRFGDLSTIDLRGLLLAGIVIGVLGVLDDVTTAQTAAVKEIAHVTGRIGIKPLFKKGLSVGREHIVSLVNTLALAYAGASLPLLLLFSMNEGAVPVWLVLNGEMIAEEVVRTLVGSTVLVLAVPLSTVLAAWYYGGNSKWLKKYC